MVDMYKLKFTNLQQEILRYLFIKEGLSLNLRSLARSLNVSSTAVSKALKGLKKEKLVDVEKDKESGRLSIEINRDNLKIGFLKRVENLKMVYESGLVYFLSDKFPGATIILFGSYSRGEDINSSDIDIAIIGAKEKNIDLIKFNKKFEKTIILNFYSSFKKIHKHLRDNILNGIVLAGGMDL